jgi:hypothetical protein
LNTGNINSDYNFIGDSQIVEDEVIKVETVSDPENELTDEELIKKYFKNPIGILPYYGPN